MFPGSTYIETQTQARRVLSWVSRKTEESCIAAQLVCSDKATFYLSNTVNHNNICVWGFQNFHKVTVSEQNSPKVNMFCAISHHKINGPCFFAEKLINGNIYLDMLINWFKPQLYEDSTSSRTVYLLDFIWRSNNIWTMHYHSNGWPEVPKKMTVGHPGPPGQQT